MADYGHDLAFGTFLTPRNDRPQDVVALAQLSERAGLDLVTFQDHPYQAAFLDTWTLLSWVAAQTETIHVSGNVLNLALRPPAVLARAAASLDRLSGGRFDLGLGGGGFPDAAAAMGAPKRTPGETVTALSEGIDILRAIWDTSARGGVRVDGEQYRVVGAKRGPAPLHDIPIWLGVVKPRMLRLTGRKADGWLPSLMYVPVPDLIRGNAIIDEAAAGAGRDPREVRRLVNISGSFAPADGGVLQGPPEQWVEELLPLAVEHGFSTFILASDDPEAIARYGAEVAPALREAVARERREAGTVTGAVVRGPHVLEQRRDGIAYDDVPDALRAGAVEPGDKAYNKVRSTYMHRGAPGLVLRPQHADEVAQALAFARAQDVPLAVRSGGHGVSSRSTNDGGVVIDLGRLSGVEVLDPASGRIRVGAGARWGQVARELLPHGLAVSSGDYGDVGVGGLATAGGLGFLARAHGLTIDRVRAAEVVLADGRIVRAGAEEHPDLLWGLRGAGANMGIVTALELDAAVLGNVVHADLVFDAADTASLLERYGLLQESAPRELTAFLYVIAQGDRPVARIMAAYASDDAEAAVAALTPFLDLGPVLQQQAQLVPYAALVPSADDPLHRGGGGQHVSNGLADHLTPELAGLLAEGFAGGVAPWLAIRPVGGAVNDVPADATAYAHRHQNFDVSSVSFRGATAEFRAHWDALRPHLDGLYINFETDDRPERLHDAYPDATLARLREVKAQYDPENVFDANFPVAPAGAELVS